MSLELQLLFKKLVCILNNLPPLEPLFKSIEYYFYNVLFWLITAANCKISSTIKFMEEERVLKTARSITMDKLLKVETN